jgi:cold shock protein
LCRICRLVFAGNRILALQPVLSLDDTLATRSFRTFPKSGLWREATARNRRAVSALRLHRIWDRLRRQTMQKGTVKWFNPTKGYGFIKPAGGDNDVFVHISAVERAGLRTLNEGQEVEYELVTNRGRSSAENLKVA